jgi:transcriptional regulator with XRE-family HTH domain
MLSGRAISQSRRRAGLTQRELAKRTGLDQSAVARLESGRIVPRVDTLDHLLRACGRRLEAVPIGGQGVDRSAIRALLRLTPTARLNLAVREARNLSRLMSPEKR